ncbi:MAG: carboxyltransferase domain-containing protein, partial [Chloroflexia bacterium]
MSAENSAPEFRPTGDSGLMIYFRQGSPNEPSSEARLLADALEASPPPGVVDFVPARASILVVFDPLQTTRH